MSQAQYDFACRVLPKGYTIVKESAIEWLFENHRVVYDEFYRRLGTPDSPPECGAGEH